MAYFTVLDTLTEVSNLMCGRPNALKIEDEFKIGEADNVDNTDDIEKAVEAVIDTLKEEANKAKNATINTEKNTDTTQNKDTTPSSSKTQTGTGGNSKKNTESRRTSRMEPMLWSAYQLRELMEFKSEQKMLLQNYI